MTDRIGSATAGLAPAERARISAAAADALIAWLGEIGREVNPGKSVDAERRGMSRRGASEATPQENGDADTGYHAA
jgi:hypothetical protein